MTTHRMLIRLFWAAALAAGLAGCGGGGGDDNNAPPSATLGDSFIDRVQAIIATTSEDGDPVPVADIVATTPDNTEPAALR